MKKKRGRRSSSFFISVVSANGHSIYSGIYPGQHPGISQHKPTKRENRKRKTKRIKKKGRPSAFKPAPIQPKSSKDHPEYEALQRHLARHCQQPILHEEQRYYMYMWLCDSGNQFRRKPYVLVTHWPSYSPPAHHSWWTLSESADQDGARLF